jgi:hypothetical protein
MPACVACREVENYTHEETVRHLPGEVASEQAGNSGHVGQDELCRAAHILQR